jgi:hypothetical protein
MRSKSTIEFLGLRERINNQNFKGVEFDSFWQEAESNTFVLSPSKWIKNTNAIGLISKVGKTDATPVFWKDWIMDLIIGINL